MDTAASLDVVCYLQEHRKEKCSSAAMGSAAADGKLDIVRFLHEHYRRCDTTKAANNAVRQGHLEIVRFFHDKCPRVRWSPDAMDAAAEIGHVDVLLFLND